MSKLSDYIHDNKEIAYDFATQNTPVDEAGRPIIEKDDEWITEIEWDSPSESDVENQIERKVLHVLYFRNSCAKPKL